MLLKTKLSDIKAQQNVFDIKNLLTQDFKKRKKFPHSYMNFFHDEVI